MTWTRVDDGFAEHNKVVGLSDAALRLWLMVSCWSRKPQNLKHEGKFPASLLVHIGQNRWPEKRALQLAAELVAANGGGLYEHGLWLVTHDGWLIHDWHVYGIVGAEPDSLSAKRSDAGKRGAASRWQTNSKPDGKSMANTMAPHELANGESMPPNPIPIPDQNTPPPSVGTPQGGDIAKSALDSFAPDPAVISSRRKTPSKKPKPAQWCRFPGDFEPDDSHRQLAADLGLNLAQQLTEIRDHQFAKPKSDPAATLRTWLRNAVKFGSTVRVQQRNQPKQPNGGSWTPRVAADGEF